MKDALEGPLSGQAAPQPLDLTDLVTASREFRIFGNYKLLDEIGQGGMGVVYRAWDLDLDRLVALKMILSAHLAGEDQINRFRLEAKSVAQFDHPNIVGIHEAGEHNGQPYFSMKFIEGGDLRAELKRHGGSVLPLRRAAELMVPIARAVHHAHELGILHRDLKPGNILLDARGNPYVADFGLAKVVHQHFSRAGPDDERKPSADTISANRSVSSPELTRAGSMMGTPGYASPEQAMGKTEEVTKASDVFGLGAILYRLITGQTPYPANRDQFLKMFPRSGVRKPSTLNPRINADLEAVCLKCLQWEPTHRYATAEALADDLDHWLRGEVLVARPVGLRERAQKWVRRRPVKAGLIATAAASVLLAAGLFFQWHRAEHQRREREAAHRRLSLKTAEDHFRNDRADLALTSLARALREWPDDRAAAERFLNALSQRTFLVPVAQTLPLPPDTGEVSPDGTRRVSGRSTNAISILALPGSNVLVQIPNAHERVIRDVRFNSDGRLLVSAGADSNAIVWSGFDGAAQFKIPHPAAVHHAEFSPDGSRLVTASADGAARLWNGTNGQSMGDVMWHENAVKTARFNVSGLRLLTASVDQTIRLWNTQTTSPASEPARLPTAVLDARFAPDRRHVVALTFDDRTNTFFITRPAAWSVASPEETAAALGLPSPARTQRLVELREKIAAHIGGEIRFVDLSPDGSLVAAGCADGAARLWLTRTLEPQVEPMFHDAKVNCVRFSPDGLRLVTSTSTGKVRLWDVQTGQPLCDSEYSSGITAVGFSSEGDWVVTSEGLKFEIPRVEGNVPAWLPQLAESLVSGFSAQGAAAPSGQNSVSLDLDAWQKLPPTNRLVRWVKGALGGATE